MTTLRSFVSSRPVPQVRTHSSSSQLTFPSVVWPRLLHHPALVDCASRSQAVEARRQAWSSMARHPRRSRGCQAPVLSDAALLHLRRPSSRSSWKYERLSPLPSLLLCREQAGDGQTACSDEIPCSGLGHATSASSADTGCSLLCFSHSGSRPTSGSFRGSGTCCFIVLDTPTGSRLSLVSSQVRSSEEGPPSSCTRFVYSPAEKDPNACSPKEPTKGCTVSAWRTGRRSHRRSPSGPSEGSL
jgi:hypothetical protein